MAAALCSVPGCLVAASAAAGSQRHAGAAPRPAATLRQQPWRAASGLLPPQQLQQRPSIAASRRRRHAAAPAAVATTGDGGGSGEPAPPAVGAAGGLKQLLRAVYDWLCSIKPPKSLWRSIAALVLGGEALVRILQGEGRLALRESAARVLRVAVRKGMVQGNHIQTNKVLALHDAGKIHWKNTIEQLDMVGPRSLGVCLLTAAFVGMVFTIQFIRWVAAGVSVQAGGWLIGRKRRMHAVSLL